MAAANISGTRKDSETITVRTPADEASEVTQALEAGLVQKFEVLGLLSLRCRQIRILQMRERLIHVLGRRGLLHFNYDNDPKEGNNDPESGKHPVRTAVEDKAIEKALWENWENWERAVHPEGRERDERDERDELTNELVDEIDQYYDAILKYRQVLNLPAFKVERKTPGERRREFRYLKWNAFSETLAFTATNNFVGDFQLFRNKAGEGEYVSLDVCTCYDICPKWYTRISDLASWTLENTPKNLLAILLLAVLALLPAGTIFGLYAIPSTWGRLGLIAGESGAIVTVLTVLKEYIGDFNTVTYMLGLAAIQVVFVGSVISSK